ncbi:MAG TPA: ELWxxDGT repeat protein [Herpetosiphonaceae bacterium]
MFFSTFQSPIAPGLWKTDGESTELLLEFDPPQSLVDLTALGERVFFTRCDDAHGCELWASDGTAAGTRLFYDFAPGPASSWPMRLTAAGDKLYVSVAVSAAEGLWVTDGTEQGTSQLTGTAESILFPPNGLTAAGERLFFTLYDQTSGHELWLTEGTSATTRLVKDIVPGPEPATISELTVVSDTLYFRASDNVHGPELWRSDGTEQGTRMVADLIPGNDAAFPDHLTAAGAGLFFTAYDSPDPAGLWYSDGTAAGTREVWQEPGTYLVSLMRLGSRALFVTDANELWVSDGTPAGTRLIRAFGSAAVGAAGAASDPFGSVDWNGRLYFAVSTPENGSELWASDGTAAGTRLGADIRPGAASSTPRWLTLAGDQLIFTADDGVHGDEAWVSDGTAAGTRLLANLAPELPPVVYLPAVQR